MIRGAPATATHTKKMSTQELQTNIDKNIDKKRMGKKREEKKTDLRDVEHHAGALRSVGALALRWVRRTRRGHRLGCAGRCGGAAAAAEPRSRAATAAAAWRFDRADNDRVGAGNAAVRHLEGEECGSEEADQRGGRRP